jgi:D-glycero-D-manno-heptose 1,7-bisphosphate phosphatase
MRPAVFLDRDGTLIQNLHHASDPLRIEILPGVAGGLRELQARGYALLVVTNQGGVARGYYTFHDVQRMNAALDRALRDEGLRIDAYYFCPHHPRGTVSAFAGLCLCRKPRPGLLLRAASDLDLDLQASWLIGNATRDVLAGHAAGCRTVLVGGDPANASGADVVAASIEEAAGAILRPGEPRHGDTAPAVGADF